MRRPPHENVATVLVDPTLVADLELRLGAHDLWLWPIATAPICVDGPRQAFQVRHRMVEARRGEWDDAADWLPAWVSFGPSWRHGEDPLPWEAHEALWSVLEGCGTGVRYRRRLGGVRPLPVPHDAIPPAR